MIIDVAILRTRRRLPTLLLGLSVLSIGACTGNMGNVAPNDSGAGDGGGSGGGQSGSGGRATGTGGDSASGGAAGSAGNPGDASGMAGATGSDGASAGSAGSGTIGTTEPTGQPTLPSGRGAIMPFSEYEAEAGT
ncbi:MAG TPA: hypothetical protein VFH73_08520, partial [Polyangia bacterium]|nr:hypothetical protein [Polyangia bacterium]